MYLPHWPKFVLSGAQSKAEKARAEAPAKGKAETEEERAEKEEERRAAKKKEEQVRGDSHYILLAWE